MGAPVIGATVFARKSRAACVIGSNVTFTQTGIVVSGGCRAYFNLTVQSERPAYTLSCSSDNIGVRDCVAPEARAQGSSIHAVWLGNQESFSSCRLGLDYRIIGDTLRVSGGCRAVFNYTVE